MNKKTYAAPAIAVTAIEVQSIMAGSPVTNTISDEKIVFDPSDGTTTIEGDEAMGKANIFIWE